MSCLADLELGELATKPFSFMRRKADGTEKEVHVRIRAMTKREMDEARINACAIVNRKWTKADAGEKGQTFEELLEDQRILECLAIAVRDAEDVSRPWATAMLMEQMLTSSETSALYKVLVDWQESTSPILTTMTEEKFEGMLEQLVKEASADPFVLLGSHLQKSFLLTMACQLVASRTANSLLSSQCEQLEQELTSRGGASDVSDTDATEA